MNDIQSNGIEIRRACLDDADAIAEFHVCLWRETYRDIAPVAAIKVLDKEHRLRSWETTLKNDPDNQFTYVALKAGELIGIINFGTTKQAEFRDLAEIKHLYVDQRWRGCGLGKRLLSIAFRDLGKRGYQGVGLAVVEENLAARNFYKAVGGNETATFTDPGPMWRSKNILVSWSLRDPNSHLLDRSCR